MDVQEIFWLFVNPVQAIRGVRDFLELGGDVLLLIMITTFVLWGMMHCYVHGKQSCCGLPQKIPAARSHQRALQALRINVMIH